MKTNERALLCHYFNQQIFKTLVGETWVRCTWCRLKWKVNLELLVFSSRSVLLLPLMFTAFQAPIKLKCVCWITSKSWSEKSKYHNTNITLVFELVQCHHQVTIRRHRLEVVCRCWYVEVFSGKFMDFLPHLFDSRVLQGREENQEQQDHLASRCCVFIVFWFFLILQHKHRK